MSKQTEALKLALEALEESLGYVEDEAETAQRLYGQYPTRKARIQGLKDDARKHMDAITAIREALAEQPAQQQEPLAWKLVPVEPTYEMLKAMDECSTEGYDERLYAGHAASVYMAAVDVAPTPPQRKPLSDEEIILIVAECASSHQHTDIHFARAIEAAVWEKQK